MVFPGVPRALKRLQERGYLLVIVSNQSGVGRGFFTMEDVDAVNARLQAELGAQDVGIDKIYIAPEAPDMPSRGRKPSPQFLFDARDEFHLALEQSYMIGDKLIDLECGWNAGVRKSILVRTGYGAEAEKTLINGKPSAAVVVDDVSAAADWIIFTERSESKNL